MESDNIRLVSVDPGNNLGSAVLDFDYSGEKIIVQDFHTLNLARYIPADEEIPEVITILNRQALLRRFLKNYLETWSPNIACHETAYVPHRGGGASISSFASLTGNIVMIKFSFRESSKEMPVFAINPTSVKMCVVGEKSNDKNAVLNALLKDSQLDFSNVDTDKLDQHSADAIAIGVTCIRNHLTLEQNTISFRRRMKSGRRK